MAYPKFWPLMLLSAVLALALSACSTNTDMVFNGNGTWEVRSELAYNAGLFDIIKGEIPGMVTSMVGGGDLEKLLMKAALDGDIMGASLQVVVNHYTSQGLSAQAESLGQRGQQAVYRLVVRGNDYLDLNRVLPNAITLVPVEGHEQRYTLTVNLGQWVALTQLLGMEQVITVRAGRIVEHNATNGESFGAVVWRNPSLVRVTFEQATPLGDVIIWAVVAVAALGAAVGGGWALYNFFGQRTGGRRPAGAYRPPAGYRSPPPRRPAGRR